MPGPTRHLPPNESTNDRQVREPITGLWTPLNNVLAEFEGEFTGESHALLDAYGNASHLKLFLASLQLSRAKIDQQAFEKRLSKAAGKNRKQAKIFKRLIKGRKQAVRAHAMVYAAQAAAEMIFVHSLAFNERAAMSKDYVKRNIDSASRLPMARGVSSGIARITILMTAQAAPKTGTARCGLNCGIHIEIGRLSRSSKIADTSPPPCRGTL